MARLLVTGGTGALGSAVVNHLKSTDNSARLLSRKPAPVDLDSGIEWAQGDIVSGVGLMDALKNVDIVVNCTGDAQNVYETDVLGVKRLAEAAKQAEVRHFFHISIVGIERIDLAYYRHKISAETAVIDSGVPYSIQRVTQFHTLLDFMMTKLKESPEGFILPIAHDALFQLIDTRDVAAYTAPFLTAEPVGRLPDVGGSEILRVAEIARTYLKARGIDNPAFVDPEKGFFPPSAVEAFRQGINTVPENRYGQITWADYVGEMVSSYIE